MVKRRQSNVGVVGESHRLTPTDLEALEDADLLKRLSPETLDSFLAEQFQTTTQEENGMPPLSWLKEKLKTKSAVIRYLHHKGFSVNQIHKHLGIRYQHVRNVLTTELKRGPNEPFKIDDYAAPGIPNYNEDEE